MRTTSLAVLLFASACSPSPELDAGVLEVGPIDAPRLDTPELDAPGTDTSVTDAAAASCAPPAPFDVARAPSRTLHVAVGGSGDGSEGAPFGSIAEGIRAATPGTLVLVHAGTYAGTVYLENVNGTELAPIWLRGEDGAVLDATGQGEAMHVSSSSYFVIEHLELFGAQVNGLNIDDGGILDSPAHHVVLRDLFVHDIGTGGNNDCIKLSGLDDFFVLDSRIARCNAGDGVDQVGCHRGLLRGNHFSELGGGGIQMKGGSSDTLVHGNWFEDVASRGINAGGSTGLAFFRPPTASFEAARLTIESNVFVRVGATSGAAIAFVGCDGCRFIHNTVVDPQTWVARILQETVDARFVPCRNGLFANNLIVFDTADLRTFVNVGPDTAPETFTFASNLWFARDDPSFTGPGWSDGLLPEMDSIIQEDPRLPDPPGAPCTSVAAAARGRVLPEASADYDGQCWEPAPTVGAFVAASCTL